MGSGKIDQLFVQGRIIGQYRFMEPFAQQRVGMPLWATVINAVIQGKAMSVVIVAALGLNELSCLL